MKETTIKDTLSYSMLSTCTFIQTMLKRTPVNREGERQREKGGREGETRVHAHTHKCSLTDRDREFGS